MNINDFISGSNAKLFKTSVRVIDETGKTKGVVTDLVKFKDLQPNKQIAFSKALRAAGVWGSSKGLIDYTYFYNNQLYLFRNINPEKYYSDDELNKINAFYENVKSYGITILEFSLVA